MEGYGTVNVPVAHVDFLMGNGDLANIGKILVFAGFFSLMFGGFLYSLANPGGFCSTPLQPPGSNGPGCAVDYSPLVLPTVAGGALIVAGAWLFWVFKPQSRIPPSQYDDRTESTDPPAPSNWNLHQTEPAHNIEANDGPPKRLLHRSVNK